MKKVLLFIILLVCIMPSYVFADNTTFCSYSNNVIPSSNGSRPRMISIYYDMSSNKFTISYVDENNNPKSKSGSYNDIFGSVTSNPYIRGPRSYLNDIESFVCPNYAVYSPKSYSICFGNSESDCSAYLPEDVTSVQKSNDIAVSIANYINSRMVNAYQSAGYNISDSDNYVQAFAMTLSSLYSTALNQYYNGKFPSPMPSKLENKIKSLVNDAIDEQFDANIKGYVQNANNRASIYGFTQNNQNSSNPNSSGNSSTGGNSNTSGNNNSAGNSNTSNSSDSNSFCSDTALVWRMIGYIIIVLKIFIPLLLIIFGMIDYGKATISNEDKALSKATSSLIKRIISAVAIFFVPTIVNAIMSIINLPTSGASYVDCLKCMIDVSSCRISENN